MTEQEIELNINKVDVSKMKKKYNSNPVDEDEPLTIYIDENNNRYTKEGIKLKNKVEITENKEEPSVQPKIVNENVKQINDKLIKDLTNEERNIIISNHSNGIENTNFIVKTLKNGNISINRRSHSKLKVDTPKNNDEIKVEHNNNSLFNNILELQSKYDKLHLKQKKLKKKYKKLKSDIYVDNNDNDESNNEQVVNNVKTIEEPEIKNNNNNPIEEIKEVNEVKEKYNNIVPNKQGLNKRLNFRDRLLLSRSIAQLR